MQYLCLIYESEKERAKVPEAERNAEFAEYFAFNAQARAAGVLVGGEALMPVSTATTVRKASGKVSTTDGPFAETKEQLGGYYLLECKDLDEAVTWAQKIPAAKHGSIEIRPIMVIDGDSASA